MMMAYESKTGINIPNIPHGQNWNNLRKKTNDYCNDLQSENNINIHRSKPIRVNDRRNK